MRGIKFDVRPKTPSGARNRKLGKPLRNRLQTRLAGERGSVGLFVVGEAPCSAALELHLISEVLRHPAVYWLRCLQVEIRFVLGSALPDADLAKVRGKLAAQANHSGLPLGIHNLTRRIDDGIHAVERERSTVADTSRGDFYTIQRFNGKYDNSGDMHLLPQRDGHRAKPRTECPDAKLCTCASFMRIAYCGRSAQQRELAINSAYSYPSISRKPSISISQALDCKS